MSTVFAFEAIGTHWQIDILDALENGKEDEIEKAVHARIDVFDRAYSRFRGDSLVMEIAKKAGTYRLPDDAFPMLKLYRELYDKTEGLFTPFIGKALAEAGYDETYSLRPGVIHVPPKWEDVLEVHEPNIKIKQPTLLDFGAAGKGYLVDLVGELLLAQNIRNFRINAGGDIIHRSTLGEAMRVGLEDPQDTSRVIGVASIQNQSICGSAGNRRAWDRFHHIMHPHTLSSPTDIAAVWVVADTTMLADAISTCLFFVPPEKLQTDYAFEYLILYPNRSVKHSEKFPAEIFTF